MWRYPLNRFHALANLSAREVELLSSLGGAAVKRPRRETFQRQGDVTTGLHLLIEGWVNSSVTLASGKCLVQKAHLPGDMLGSPSMVIGTAVDTLTTITDAVTAFVSYERMGQLFATEPRLTSLFIVAVQMERLSLIDMLAMTGAASAKESLARFLLDLHSRLTPLGAVSNNSFDLPLTQEMIGDLLGLTSVHVNRTMRDLEQQGLISRQGHRLTLVDVPGLRRLSPIPPRTPLFEPGWLPAHT